MSEKVNLPVFNSESGFYRYLHEVNQIPSLSHEEEMLLAKTYIEQNDIASAQKLVKSHLKLVAKIAMGYKNYGLPVPELVSEGNLGLMQAVKKFNPDLGFRLSTYAMWWIKAAIQEYVLKSWSLVKIGTTAAQKKLFFSLGKIKHKIVNLYSRSINNQDLALIAKELGVSLKEATEMNTRLAGGDISLNQPKSNDENQTTELIDYLPENRPNQEALLITKQDSAKKHSALIQGINLLNAREIEIFTERKLKDLPATLEELSIRYKISKERVRQIEQKAFKKVQEYVLSSTAMLNQPSRPLQL